ncbi:ClpXP protease specificity-enhancing factor [Pseudazoarcus pumilus]|uniref:ClpXP protease specificity-enhancing factor n=1 Tax=Pseudazoarcus pumilus TaxID=2067960 RepID=A0A2I6S4D5_9RHOO|nr:ClpXP protease specificity-enhancing factor [Pseudazoarcus pumilus]AUN94124.1 ClpXP protease specificity-enhancing factor [Pseudazoarcus pumilus]
MTSSTLSTRPYLVRAINEWCLDEGLTPYVVVHVDGDVLVPPGYARDGQIVLNLDPDATHRLSIDNDGIGFQARFGGAPHDIWIPYANLLAIYARENGRGLAFTQGVAFELNPEGDDEAGDETVDDGTPADDAPVESASGDDDTSPDEPPKGGRGGHLKVIK